MTKLFGGMSVAQLKGNLERHYAGHPDYECVEDIVEDSVDVLNDLVEYVEQYSPEYVHDLESDIESFRYAQATVNCYIRELEEPEEDENYLNLIRNFDVDMVARKKNKQGTL